MKKMGKQLIVEPIEIVTISKKELEQMFNTFLEPIYKKLDAITSKSVLENLPTYITSLEFMEKARIKRSTFDKLIDNNTIKYVKMDRKYLIPAEELEKYFNNLSNSKN